MRPGRRWRAIRNASGNNAARNGSRKFGFQSRTSPRWITSREFLAKSDSGTRALAAARRRVDPGDAAREYEHVLANEDAPSDADVDEDGVVIERAQLVLTSDICSTEPINESHDRSIRYAQRDVDEWDRDGQGDVDIETQVDVVEVHVLPRVAVEATNSGLKQGWAIDRTMPNENDAVCGISFPERQEAVEPIMGRTKPGTFGEKQC